MSTRPPNAIAGNESFTHIQSFTEQVNRLDANDISSRSLSVNKVAFGNFSDFGAYPGAVRSRITGYAPTDFVGKKHNEGFFFNKAPGLAEAASADAKQLLALPIGAVIHSVRLTNNGKTVNATGATESTAAINLQAWAAGGPSSANLMNLAPIIGSEIDSNANNAAGLATYAHIIDPDESFLGKTGVSNDGLVQGDQFKRTTAASRNVGLTVSIKPNGPTDNLAITSGDLAVTIEYTILD